MNYKTGTRIYVPIYVGTVFMYQQLFTYWVNFGFFRGYDYKYILYHLPNAYEKCTIILQTIVNIYIIPWTF